MTAPDIDTLLFDLAGVLINWDARPLYEDVFAGDEQAVRAFFNDTLTPEKQAQIAKGRPTQELLAELAKAHPHQKHALDAWWTRWDEMLTGAFEETVALTRALRNHGYRTCVLGNWGREELDRARPRFSFLDEFDGVVVSGDVGSMKPEDAIFEAAIERLELRPGRTVFIDDKAENVDAGKRHGFHGHVFTDASTLNQYLTTKGIVL
tara:strand:+ start:102 stop:722 length:621 start_codon:yes stop_codon:yes gene_type:complete